MICANETLKPDDVQLTRAQASTLLSHWLSRNISCKSLHPLEGGICSAVFRLQFDAPPYSAVIKIYDKDKDDPLPRERKRLDYLHQHTQLPFPAVYLQDDSRSIIPYSFLLLEYLPGINLASANLSEPIRVNVERELAEVLLELHSHTAETFHDFGQPKGTRVWNEMFLPDLEENRRDMEGLLREDLLSKIDRVLPLTENALRDQGEPTLIHNDIWGGNIMVEERADGWHLSGLIDPVGLQYAEVEKELAYLQVFDTVGDNFFKIYSSRKALREGFEFRRMFYWLDTYMTHVWLGFGYKFHEYIAKTCEQILDWGKANHLTDQRH